MQTLDTLIEAVLALPFVDQQKLVDVVEENLAALEFDRAPLELHPSWREEIERRVRELDSGPTRTFTWEEVKAYARKRIEENA